MVQDASATVSAGSPGASVGLSLVPNQHGLLQFSAAANQTLALYVLGNSVSPNVPVMVTQVGTSNRTSFTSGQSVTFNLPSLTAGNYSLLVAPISNGTTVSMQAALANGATAALPVDDTSVPLQTYVPGQAAYYTFAGNAGQSLSLVLTQLALTPSTVGHVNINVSAPNGAYVTSATCYLGATPGCQLGLRGLTQTGNYLIAVTPSGPATMGLALNLSQDITGTLVLGTASNVTLSSLGQNALYTFTTTASGSVVVTAGSITTSPANTPVTIYVYNASNTLIQSLSMTLSGTMNLGTLAAGTYTVLVTPNNGATGSLQLTVQTGGT